MQTEVADAAGALAASPAGQTPPPGFPLLSPLLLPTPQDTAEQAMYSRMARQARRASYEKVAAELIATSSDGHASSSPRLGPLSPLLLPIIEGTADQAMYDKLASQFLRSPYSDEQPQEVMTPVVGFPHECFPYQLMLPVCQIADNSLAVSHCIQFTCKAAEVQYTLQF